MVLLLALAQALDAGMGLHQLAHDPAVGGLVPPRARAQLRSVVGEGGSLAAALARAGVVDEAGAAVIGAGERGGFLPAELRSVVGEGGSLAAALARAGVVDEAGAAVIGAGERGGFLPAALRLVAADVEERRRRRRRLMLALAYPALLVLLASVILPLPVVVTEGVDAYLARAMPGVVAVLGALVLGLVVAPRVPAHLRGCALGVLARVPLVGAVVVDDARAALLELLGRLIAAGMPARGALATALCACALPRVRGRAELAERALDGRRGLAEALVEAAVVDTGLGARVALAERTGDLDTTLPQLARELRERAARRMVALAVAAGMVAFLLVAVGIARALVVQTQATFDAIDRATAE